MDVVGYNYRTGDYPKLHATHPHIVILAAETQSAISSRGEYFFPVSDDKNEGQFNFQISSYDTSSVLWGLIPDAEFEAQEKSPFVLGEFVWTGFDYLGEPSPYNKDTTNLLNFTDPAEQARVAEDIKRLGKITVPSRSSYFGIADLAGFPKDRYYNFQAHWRPGHPMAHILPHWTWPERAGLIVCDRWATT